MKRSTVSQSANICPSGPPVKSANDQVVSYDARPGGAQRRRCGRLPPPPCYGGHHHTYTSQPRPVHSKQLLARDCPLEWVGGVFRAFLTVPSALLRVYSRKAPILAVFRLFRIWRWTYTQSNQPQRWPLSRARAIEAERAEHDEQPRKSGTNPPMLTFHDNYMQLNIRNTRNSTLGPLRSSSAIC